TVFPALLDGVDHADGTAHVLGAECAGKKSHQGAAAVGKDRGKLAKRVGVDAHVSVGELEAEHLPLLAGFKFGERNAPEFGIFDRVDGFSRRCELCSTCKLTGCFRGNGCKQVQISGRSNGSIGADRGDDALQGRSVKRGKFGVCLRWWNKSRELGAS